MSTRYLPTLWRGSILGAFLLFCVPHNPAQTGPGVGLQPTLPRDEDAGTLFYFKTWVNDKWIIVRGNDFPRGCGAIWLKSESGKALQRLETSEVVAAQVIPGVKQTSLLMVTERADGTGIHQETTTWYAVERERLREVLEVETKLVQYNTDASNSAQRAVFIHKYFQPLEPTYTDSSSWPIIQGVSMVGRSPVSVPVKIASMGVVQYVYDRRKRLYVRRRTDPAPAAKASTSGAGRTNPPSTPTGPRSIRR